MATAAWQAAAARRKQHNSPCWRYALSVVLMAVCCAWAAYLVDSIAFRPTRHSEAPVVEVAASASRLLQQADSSPRSFISSHSQGPLADAADATSETIAQPAGHHQLNLSGLSDAPQGSEAYTPSEGDARPPHQAGEANTGDTWDAAEPAQRAIAPLPIPLEAAPPRAVDSVQRLIDQAEQQPPRNVYHASGAVKAAAPASVVDAPPSASAPTDSAAAASTGAGGAAPAGAAALGTLRGAIDEMNRLLAVQMQLETAIATSEGVSDGDGGDVSRHAKAASEAALASLEVIRAQVAAKTLEIASLLRQVNPATPAGGINADDVSSMRAATAAAPLPPSVPGSVPAPANSGPAGAVNPRPAEPGAANAAGAPIPATASVHSSPATNSDNTVLQTKLGPITNPFYNRPTYKCRMLGRLHAPPAQVTREEYELHINAFIPTLPWDTFKGEYIIPTDFSSLRGKKRDKSQPDIVASTGLINGVDQAFSVKASTTRTASEPWSMGWPRFLRPEHESWFARYDIAKWRRKSKCDAEVDNALSMNDYMPSIYSNPGTQNTAVRSLGAADDKRTSSISSLFPQFGGATGIARDHQRFVFCEDQYTHGELTELKDVIVAGAGPRRHTCGPEGSIEALLINGAAAVARGEVPTDVSALTPDSAGADTLFWGDIPASWAYQHWVQNNMPKITRAALFADGMLGSQSAIDMREGIKAKLEPTAASDAASSASESASSISEGHTHFASATGARNSAVANVPSGKGAVAPMVSIPKVVEVQELLLDRYPIITPLHEHIGWSVADVRKAPIHAPRFVYSCKAPPLHPFAWQMSQVNLLRVEPRPIPERNKIVYCGRTNKGRVENKGRRVLNEDAFMSTLESIAGARGWTVDEFDQYAFQTIAELVEYFSTARILVGPHGGCLTNVVFMPCNSVVLELFPLVGGRKPPVGHAGMMMYMQSTFLEMSYWMLPIATRDRKGDITVPVQDVHDILSTALAETDNFD